MLENPAIGAQSMNSKIAAVLPSSASRLSHDAPVIVPLKPNGSFNLGAPACVPQSGEQGYRASSTNTFCHFNAACTNSRCGFLHEMDMGWNPKLQVFVKEETELQRVKHVTGVQINIDQGIGSCKLIGSMASIGAAQMEMRGFMACVYGEKCKNSSCDLCHVLTLAVRGFSNAEFVKKQDNIKAICKQTGAMINWKPDCGDLEVCGTQYQMNQAKQYLKRFDTCRYSAKCTNESCPYWYIVECDLAHPSIQEVVCVAKRLLSSVGSRFEVEVVQSNDGAWVSGSRTNVIEARNALTPCRWGEKCTNRSCTFLHVKRLPQYTGVEPGLLIGQGGCHIKEIETSSRALVHVAFDSEHNWGVWLLGTQDDVSKAEKLVRGRMFVSTDCYFGTECTDRGCKFRNPKGKARSSRFR